MLKSLNELIPTERQRAIFRFLSRIGPATTSQIKTRFEFPSRKSAYKNLWRLKQANFIEGGDYFSYETGYKEKYWYLAPSGRGGVSPKTMAFVPELKTIRKDNTIFRGISPSLHEHEFKCVDVMLKLEMDLNKAKNYGYTAELIDIIGLNRFLITSKSDKEKNTTRNIYPDRVAVVLFNNEIRFLFFELDVNANEALSIQDSIEVMRGHFGRKIEVYSAFKKNILQHPQVKKYLECYPEYKVTPFFGNVITVCFFKGKNAKEKEMRRLSRLKYYTERHGKGRFFSFGSAQEILNPNNNLCFDPIWYRASENKPVKLFELSL